MSSSRGSSKRGNRKFEMLFPAHINHVALQNAMYKYVREHPDSIAPCKSNRTNGSVHIVKLLGHEDTQAVSDSVQLLADLNKSYNGVNGVFFKVFFGPRRWHRELRGAQLHVEAEIYRDVVNPLIFYSITPHLITYYGMVNMCSVESIFDLLPTQKERQKFNNFVQDQQNAYKVEEVYMLALERTRGIDLTSLTKTYNEIHEKIDFNAILFQVVWTLMCFKEVGLMHNDLHTGNVFLTILPQKQVFVYYLSQNETYLLETDMFVQIYDFDNGAKIAKPNDPKFALAIQNSSLELRNMCGDFHMCNKYEEKYDITRFLFYMAAEYGSLTHVHALLDKLAEVTYLLSLRREHGYIHAGIPVVKESRKYEEPTYNEVLPLKEMLEVLGETGNYLRETDHTLSKLLEIQRNQPEWTVSALPSAYRNNKSTVKSPYSK